MKSLANQSLPEEIAEDHLSNLSNKNIYIVPYDSQVHDESSVRKLLSYSLYFADEEKIDRTFKNYSSKKDKTILLCIQGHKIIGFIGFDRFGTILHISVE